jgi:arabinoxylan arabinofuranohydrolase
LNPFELQEAETINKCSGILCLGDYNGCYASNITKSSYIKVRNVDFGEAGAKSFKAVVRTTGDAVILIRVKTASSTAKGRVNIPSTDGEWQEVTVDLTTTITGIQDLFFTFAGTTATSFDFDKWQFFEQPTSIQPQTTKRPSQATYDLQGRRTSNHSNHAIKIIDGKKIIK